MRRLLSRLKALWSGKLPLREAFWDWAVFWGLLLNLGSSIVSLVLIGTIRHVSASDALVSLVPWIALAFHLLPLPYNIVVLVGVWRSAGQPGIALAASAGIRMVVILLFGLFLVI